MELEISGSTKELGKIGKTLSNMNADEFHRFDADATADPDSYERCLNSLVVRATGGPVRIEVIEDQVRATGSTEMLHKFASFFDFDDDSPPGTHTHYEWYEGSPYTDEDSALLLWSNDPLQE